MSQPIDEWLARCLALAGPSVDAAPTMPHVPFPTHDAEFDLRAACCRWPQDEAASVVVQARASGIDWTRFLAMV